MIYSQYPIPHNIIILFLISYIYLLSSPVELHQLLVDSRAEWDAWLAAFLSHGSSKDGVLKEGELKSRERYWFVLQRDGLAYYAKQEDVIKAKLPKGEIELTINTTVRETNLVIGSLGRKAKFGFGIFQPSGRKYYLFADSMQELREWFVIYHGLSYF